MRWHAYNLMCAIPFTDLAKSGIHKPTDLLKFPWDGDTFHAPTDEEMEDLGRMLQEERARLNEKP